LFWDDASDAVPSLTVESGGYQQSRKGVYLHLSNEVCRNYVSQWNCVVMDMALPKALVSKLELRQSGFNE
jgi:hypothetical protein